MQNADYIRGSALVAKSQLERNSAKARYDVKQALQAPSNKLGRYGLQAYAILK